MKTCEYFEMHQYCWRGVRSIPTLTGKLNRAVQQFTPHSWTKFDWGATKTLKRWLSVILLCVLFLQCELNLFYLKFILWIPPPHGLMLARLLIFCLAGAAGCRDYYLYLTDDNCKALGMHAWVSLVLIFTELLMVVKFGKGLFTAPFPEHVVIFWAVFLSLLVGWTIWNFGLSSGKKDNGASSRKTGSRRTKSD